MSDLRVEVHAFQTPDSEFMPAGQGLWVSAKRYSTEASVKHTRGLTLLFSHCIGSHKEEWDIVIQRLFSIQSSKDERVRIREAWSFDRQNHGDAAVLNAQALIKRKHSVNVNEWALGLASFVHSPLLKGHRLVPIGHSAGTTAWMLTTREFPIASLPYESMLLVESPINKKELFETELEERMSTMELVMNFTLGQRVEWPNKQEALAHFRKQFPWRKWDLRAVKLLVDHGIQDSPDIRSGVTLKWTKKQEAASYPEASLHQEALTYLANISQVIPIHLIWGERIEFMPEYLRDSLSDPSYGMNVATVSYVKDAGHMVVQEKPDDLAEVIAAKLDTIPRKSDTLPRPKL